MTQYLFEVILFQFLFMAGYFLFFRKETGFTANRIYLLLAPAVSMVMPFIEIQGLPVQTQAVSVFTLPEMILQSSTAPEVEKTNLVFSTLVLSIIWVFGSLLSLVMFISKLYKINQIKKKSVLTTIESVRVYVQPKTKDSFTFLNAIFIGNALSETEKQTVLYHELVHKNQKHGWDLLFFEMLRVVFWFNPLLYFFQKEVKTLHEYVADYFVIRKTGKQSYYQSLLSQAFQTSEISFINTFFNLPEKTGHLLIRYFFFEGITKKRIIMLQKSNQKSNKLKYLLIIPMLGMMLFYASCTQESKPETDSVSDKIAELKVALENGTISEEDRKQLLSLLKNVTPPTPPLPPTPFNKNEVPFSAIEKAPVYPGCSGNNQEIKSCFSEKLRNLVNEKFDVSLAKRLNVTGKQRITVLFKIDKEGNITNAKARAPHPDLAAHAVAIVKSLPKMKPGENAGKKVAVVYSLPIVFDVQE